MSRLKNMAMLKVLAAWDEKKWMQAFCNRKYNSDFAREMTRSVAKYLEEFQ